jgi:hypothetical protein
MPEHLRSSRLRELASWADKIDAARYESVEEAIFGDGPALRVSTSLTLASPSDCEALVHALRHHDLHQVSKLQEVTKHFEHARKLQQAGLDLFKRGARLEPGGLVIFDVEEKDDALIHRYAPYYFFPNARYSVGVIRRRGEAKVTAMRNPWIEFPSIPLGELFKTLGGGGHQRVGSITLRGARLREAEQVLATAVAEMRRRIGLGENP